MDALTITDLEKHYGHVQALKSISLTIKKGEFYGLLGPNGAGKTTTINLVTGLAKMQKGSITVFGHDVVKDYREARRLIGLSPQDLRFDPYFNIKMNLIYQAGYFGIPLAEAKTKADALLKQFDLADKTRAFPRELSGGMKRKLSIAKALIHDPELLILDEPTAGLDVETRKSLWTYLREINAKGRTILLTTHYIEEAQALCDTLCIVNNGNIIRSGKTTEFLKTLAARQLIITLEKGTKVPKGFTKKNNEYVRTIDKPLPKILEEISNIPIKDLRIEEERLEDIFVRLTHAD